MMAMKFIYIINCALDEIRKQKFIHIILIASVFICVALFNVISVLLTPAYTDISTVQFFKNKDVYVVAPESDKAVFFSGKTETFNAINEIDNVKVGWYFPEPFLYNGNGYRTVCYTELLSSNMVLHLKTGNQLCEYDGEYVPAILSENHPLLWKYEVGDVLEFEVNTYNERISVSVEICGVLKGNASYFHGYNLNNLDYSSVLDPVLDYIILISDFQLEDGVLFSEAMIEDMDNFFWYCEITEPKDSEEFDTAYRELNSAGTVGSYREIISSTWKAYSEGFTDTVLIGFFIMLLSAVGIGSANIYIGNNQMRSFAINFICGAKWTDCLVIDIIRNLCIIVVPTFFGIAVSYGIFAPIMDQGLEFNYVNLCVVMVFMMILFAVSSLPYIIKLRNTEPIAFIRTMNRD